MPRKPLTAKPGLISGTSLVELLVVIVVFLIGILAIVQIFPGGIHILAYTKNETVATAVAHTELARIQGNPNQLPEQIANIDYAYVPAGSGNLVGTLADRPADDYSAQANQIGLATHVSTASTQFPFNEGFSGWSGGGSGSGAPIGGGFASWDLQDSTGEDLGPVSYLMGANNIRRVIGEGRVVPPPQHIAGAYGALLPLEFGPAIWKASSNAGTTLIVYGNDMDKFEGAPPGNLVNSSGTATTTLTTGDYYVAGYPTPSYQFYVDDSSPSDPYIYIPANSSDPLPTHSYKITFVAYINTGTVIIQRTYLVLSPLVVPTPTFTAQGTYYAMELDNPANTPGLLNAGETLQSIDYSSIRLARMFDRLETTDNFNVTRNPDGTPQNPYQYMIRDVDPTNNDAKRDTLGMLLINPVAYGYAEEARSGQAVLLQARVDYDVFDWRILKEDFKAPDTSPYQYQLGIGNLKHHFGYEPDGTLFEGMGFEVPNEDGTPWDFEKRDVVVVDLATGGVISKKSAQGGFDVNYSIGMLHFNPILVQLLPTPQPKTLCLYEVLPDNNGMSPVAVPISGLTVRAYYMANGEWSAQLMKSASNYQLVSMGPPLPGQVYMTAPSTSMGTNGDPTIQFPAADVGATVTFDELWYDSSNATGPQVLRGQAFIVKPADSHGHGQPYITVTDIDPYATGLDFSNNFAVRGVKGLSLSVRVLWNLNSVAYDKANATGNLSALSQWVTGYRHMTTEGIVLGGGGAQ